SHMTVVSEPGDCLKGVGGMTVVASRGGFGGSDRHRPKAADYRYKYQWLTASTPSSSGWASAAKRSPGAWRRTASLWLALKTTWWAASVPTTAAYQRR